MRHYDVSLYEPETYITIKATELAELRKEAEQAERLRKELSIANGNRNYLHRQAGKLWDYLHEQKDVVPGVLVDASINFMEGLKSDIQVKQQKIDQLKSDLARELAIAWQRQQNEQQLPSPKDVKLAEVTAQRDRLDKENGTLLAEVLQLRVDKRVLNEAGEKAVEEHNKTVDAYNELVRKHNSLAFDYNNLLAVFKGLVEEYRKVYDAGVAVANGLSRLFGR